MRKSKVKLLVIFALVFGLCFVIFFPSSIFYGKYNEQYEIHSENKNYKLVIYKYIPVSLLSIYKVFDDMGCFFVVYDQCGRKIYKPALNYGVSANLIYDETEFSTLNGNELFFPTNEGIDSIKLPSVPSTCVYK